jgi:hypothetical protein
MADKGTPTYCERMNVPAARSALALLQFPPADTVVVVTSRGPLETAAAISIIVVGVFFLVLVPLLLVVMLQVRKLNRTVRDLGERGLRRADPLLASGKGIADNLEFVSAAVRTDVERLSGMVKSLTDRLETASQRVEERVGEFNALMEVVQSEAQDIFVGTASTVRGVQAGARALREGLPGGEDEASLEEEELRRAQEELAGSVYITRTQGG